MLPLLDYYGMSSKYNCSDSSEEFEVETSEGYTANEEPLPTNLQIRN